MGPQFYGAVAGIAAFTAWGFLPAYWKQMLTVNPFEILCHRVIWSCVFLSGIVCLQKRWHEVGIIVQYPEKLKGLALSGLLIGVNWFVYIWAVNSNNVVETSLGYYINPMINVLFGYLLIGETFSKIQRIAIAFALAGVAYSLVAYRALPMFALTLAITFALYGYARKTIQVPPIPGLLIETLFLVVPALLYVLWQKAAGHSLFFKDPVLTFWMIGSGVATSLPLLWFAYAAKRLNLSTIGILQYLAPSIAFILGVFIYKEEFTRHSLVTFGFIWISVVLYTRESIKNMDNRYEGGK